MRVALFLIFALLPVAVAADSRPPAPPADQQARPDHPGWSVDEATGCWIWNPEPGSDDVFHWSGGCDAEARRQFLSDGYGPISASPRDARDRAPPARRVRACLQGKLAPVSLPVILQPQMSLDGLGRPSSTCPTISKLAKWLCTCCITVCTSRKRRSNGLLSKIAVAPAA